MRADLCSLRAFGRAAVLAAALGALPPALAQGDAQRATPVAEDPALEARVMELSHVLRCLVCQNQSIAESNAPLALDLRAQVREQLAAGRSEGEVVDYLVARYGDFVLYQPPLKASTVVLWVGPALLLFGGAGWLGWRLRRRARETAAALTEAERNRARALLAGAAPAAADPASAKESRS